jgi:murein DD-endopeptidase MepM/ murein hydrolase activator NlpD
VIDFEAHRFHPVVHLPEVYDVLDLSATPEDWPEQGHVFSIGRYDEDRVGVYTQALFGGERTIHMGIDIGGPVGTPVHAFAAGTLWCAGCNASPGDYGPTLITLHELDGVRLWALHGHLSQDSLVGWSRGQAIQPGERLGFIGSEHENGGWPPHLHFQLSLIEPQGCDLRGVVSGEERAQALKDFPDPRRVLGPLY